MHGPFEAMFVSLNSTNLNPKPRNPQAALGLRTRSAKVLDSAWAALGSGKDYAGLGFYGLGV